MIRRYRMDIILRLCAQTACTPNCYVMGGFPYSIFNSPNDNHAYNIPLRAILSSFLTICKYNIHAERYRWASPHNGDGCRAQAALSILSRVPPSTSSTHRLYQALSLLRILRFFFSFQGQTLAKILSLLSKGPFDPI